MAGRRLVRLEAGLLIVVLGAAAYLRLVNLGDNPGWYSDEGTHLAIARHLLAGRTQYLAINQSTLLFAKLPLFEWLLAGVARLWGLEMVTLRGLTAVLGIVSVALLYLLVRLVNRQAGLALLAALALAIYPQAVLYSRFGFSYNLLAPLLLLAMIGLWLYGQNGRRGWLALAAVMLGLGVLSDLVMVSALPVLPLMAWGRRGRDALWAVAIVAVPFGLYAAVGLLTMPDVFLFDLQFTLFRLNQLSLAGQLANVATNYTILLAQDAWIMAGLIGLFMMRPLPFRRLCLLLFFLPIIVLGRTAALHGLSFYYLIPFLPLVAVGVGSLLWYGRERAADWWNGTDLQEGNSGELAPALPVQELRGTQEGMGKWWGVLVVGLFVLIVGVPLVTSTWLTAGRVRGHFGTVIDPFLINGRDARTAAAFVNERLQPGEVVIASPAVAWLIEGNTADFQMAIAATGQATPHLPADIPPDRFAFDPTYNQARFVIVDNLWRNWAVFNVPGAREMLGEVEEWSLLVTAGEIEVYENPGR